MNSQPKVYNEKACRALATAVIKSAIVENDTYFLNSEYSNLFKNLCDVSDDEIKTLLPKKQSERTKILRGI